MSAKVFMSPGVSVIKLLRDVIDSARAPPPHGQVVRSAVSRLLGADNHCGTLGIGARTLLTTNTNSARAGGVDKGTGLISSSTNKTAIDTGFLPNPPRVVSVHRMSSCNVTTSSATSVDFVRSTGNILSAKNKCDMSSTKVEGVISTSTMPSATSERVSCTETILLTANGGAKDLSSTKTEGTSNTCSLSSESKECDSSRKIILSKTLQSASGTKSISSSIGNISGARQLSSTSTKTDDDVDTISPTAKEGVTDKPPTVKEDVKSSATFSCTREDVFDKSSVVKEDVLSSGATTRECVTDKSSAVKEDLQRSEAISSTTKEDASCKGTLSPKPKNKLNDGTRISVSTLPAEVAFRQGTVSDHRAVVDLIDEGGLHDYLPVLYPHLVSYPGTFSFLATWNGKVVGHIMASVLDGGLTTLYRAGRVHKDYRGLGIYKALIKHAHRYASKHLPLHVHDILSLTDRADSVCGHFLAVGYRAVYRREGMQMFYETALARRSESAGAVTLNNQIEARELTRYDLHQIFQAPTLCRELFPQGRLFNWYIGYRFLGENVQHLVTPWTGAFVSLGGEPSTSKLPFSEINQNKTPKAVPNMPLPPPATSADMAEPLNESSRTSSACNLVEYDEDDHWENGFPHRIAMVTFYACHETLYGVFYSLDAYAKRGVSPDHFRAHLRQNLEVLQSRFPGKKVALAVTFDPTISRDCVTSCLAEQGIVDLMPNQEKWQILYERPAKK
ncbi:hypothetical protein ElyMa_005500300 [Elysia marginata]|uniref:N-acetyltransferase domain-containing protein n=1 Tax=Elysia marginata TaxID=1093978 RepID=A0AAV4ET80_9GAST|nr:hypothetical protein ElyMa_005500300 [Elysia marginata]